MHRKVLSPLLAGTIALSVFPAGAQPTTYGQRLGWRAEEKVLILHNDDVGMSHESNLGTIEGFEKGLLSSCSTMMPCSWVLEWRDYLLQHPEIDNGLHLTLTSEWKHYRWRPVAGPDAVPGLLDEDGYMHHEVPAVIRSASADEVEKEVRAQIALAEKMGLPITHLDSHMGTLFYHPPFLERYIKIGIEKQIPIMMMGGEGDVRSESMRAGIQAAAKQVWEGGLPVLDYLMTSTADTSDRQVMIDTLIANLRALKPGITQIILHGTRPAPHFSAISGSGGKREAELEMVLAPEVKQVLEEEGIIMTTYRELMQRRKHLGSQE